MGRGGLIGGDRHRRSKSWKLRGMMGRLGGILFALHVWFLGFALVSLSKPVEAAELRGRVMFTRAPAEAQWVSVEKNREVCGTRRPLEQLLLSPDGGVANALVELEGVRGSRSRLSPRIAVLDNRDCRFMPRVQVAAVGALLEIRNSDAILHTAHAYDGRDGTLFHVALPHFREQVRVALDTPGLLRIICDVGHVWMRAYIYVTDNPRTVITDSQGRFAMADVSSGTYRLRVWHERLGAIAGPVSVPDRGTVAVELRYP